MRAGKAVTESVRADSGEYCSSATVALVKFKIMGRAVTALLSNLSLNKYGHGGLSLFPAYHA